MSWNVRLYRVKMVISKEMKNGGGINEEFGRCLPRAEQGRRLF